mgnify:FL=1
MAKKITKKEIKIETVLKATHIEDEVLKDSILVFIFSEIAPTYSELIKAGEIK